MPELLERVLAALDHCAVGRDHPVHRRLVEGGMSAAELREFGRQQWLWQRAFPAVLAALAAQCPAYDLRTPILAQAHAGVRRLDEWEQVCAALGLEPPDLRAARPTGETETMIAIQHAVARRPFGEGCLGIMVGVLGEIGPHVEARRRAMAESYGLPAEALAYFSTAGGEAIGDHVGVAEGHLASTGHDAALEALRLVLRTRWAYFSGVEARAGT